MPDLHSAPGRPPEPTACIVCATRLRPAWERRLPRAGAPAGAADAAPGVCDDPHCHALFHQVRHLTPEHRTRHFEGYARVRLAERERVRVQRELAEREHRRELAVFALLRARARRRAVPDLQLVVPSGHGPSPRLSQRRRRAYAAHLATIIAEAFAEPPPAPVAVAPSEPPAAAGPFAGRLCGACGGGCCASGGEAAYLSAATIRRVRAQTPGVGPAELQAAYLAHLAPRTRAKSCINHTRHGCSLPRALRSDICNTFACASLTHLQTHAAEGGPLRTVAVLRRRQNLWNRGKPFVNNDIVAAALISETATTSVRPPPSVLAASDPSPG